MGVSVMMSDICDQEKGVMSPSPSPHHHLPNLPSPPAHLFQVSSQTRGTNTSHPTTYPQTIADSLLPSDGLPCTMFSYSETQDKEDVNTKIAYGPHSSWDHSALFSPFSTLCPKVLFQSIFEACPSHGSYIERCSRIPLTLFFPAIYYFICSLTVYGDHEPRGEAIG